jgi:5-methylcytosine-specific restriction protein B
VSRLKQVRSWSKPEKPNLIARKKVDWSIFINGSHIPLDFHEDFEAANQGYRIHQGDRHHVQLIIRGEAYSAVLSNYNRQGASESFQLRYDHNKALKDLLVEVFKNSYTYIESQKASNSEQKNIHVPDSSSEYIEFYQTDKPFVYEVLLIPTILYDKEIIDHVYAYITSKGFYYERREVMNLFLSLKTKPFVILSGISGTGKTKLIQWFAESLGATEENGRFTLIPVRPDWSDGSDLLGYTDIKGEFIVGRLTHIILDALQHPDEPYFVLLDEMNLARVEYYFSDILSVMESRKWVDGEILTSSLIDREIDGKLVVIPSNVFFIGTVNMDETTHPFSKKVLDRANTIEFNSIKLDHLAFLEEQKAVDAITVPSHALSGDYLHLKDIYIDYKDLIVQINDELIHMNTILQELGAHVGYRVRDEICFYMAYNQRSGLMSFEAALDQQIMQKLLPRISGSDTRVFKVLNQLFLFFTNHQLNDEQLDSHEGLEHATYPLSAHKVFEMRRRFLLNGFTSFWLGA